MKIVQINVNAKGSIGRITAAVSRKLTENQIENYIFYGMDRATKDCEVRFSNTFEEKISALFAKVRGNSGFNSVFTTRKLIRKLKKIHPDIVHLHNLHNHNVNLTMLFDYFRKENIKVFWTFHDCWAFTGYCTHYTIAKCTKWQEKCADCPQYRQYSWLFDNSTAQQDRKVKAFSDVDLTIITPSEWLGSQVRKSRLKGHKLQVIHNGINLQAFSPRDVREEYPEYDGKHIVLGVAFNWSYAKGLDIFLELAQELGETYQIILVGTNEKVDAQLPANIKSIHRTHNQDELAKLYSLADVFVNPTREENYPTVNIEALACGTPIVSFDTGGCKETFDETCGTLVPTDDYAGMLNAIRYVCEKKPFDTASCVAHAALNDERVCFNAYVDLYKATAGEKEDDAK